MCRYGPTGLLGGHAESRSNVLIVIATFSVMCASLGTNRKYVDKADYAGKKSIKEKLLSKNIEGKIS